MSIRVYFLPSRSKSISIASRVVPGISKAITRSSPSSVLIRVDLPTLGRPTMANDAVVDDILLELFAGVDRRRDQAAQGDLDQVDDAVAVRGGNRMRLAQAQLVEIAGGVAHAHAFGLVDRQQHALLAGLAQQARDLVIVRIDAARASTRNTTTSASAMAWRVWRAISARMPSLAVGSKPPVSITRKGVSPPLPSP